MALLLLLLVVVVARERPKRIAMVRYGLDRTAIGAGSENEYMENGCRS